MRRSASAISTNAGLSIVFRMSVIVSVTLGEVPATCHNPRSASASSGRHSRMKNGSGWVFVLSDTSIVVIDAIGNRTYQGLGKDSLLVKPTHHAAQVLADLFYFEFCLLPAERTQHGLVRLIF